MALGILSLGDLQRDQRTGRPHRPVDRMAEILGYAVLADQLGLDVFALGEHHSAEFLTSSPAVVLAAAAARTSRIRLTSATTLLGVADPVRVYEDFASPDLISPRRRAGQAVTASAAGDRAPVLRRAVGGGDSRGARHQAGQREGPHREGHDGAPFRARRVRATSGFWP